MRPPSGATGQARQRVLDAALELFAEHGISGTSLQMIADRIGVTKAAVYHQFPVKGDIVLGLVSEAFIAIDELVTAVESAPAPDRHPMIIEGVVGLMVQQRRVASALYRDPETERVVSQDADLSAIRARLAAVLVDPDAAGARRQRLGWVVIGAGFTRALVDPEFVDLSDEELRVELVSLARQMLDQDESRHAADLGAPPRV